MITNGVAYDLTSLARRGDEIWVICGLSEQNQQIALLSPATRERVCSESIQLKSKNGAMRWLLPQIALRIHSQDLSERSVADQFRITETDFEDNHAATSPSDAEENALEQLQLVGVSIEHKLHAASNEQEPIRLTECHVLQIDPAAREVKFAWRSDSHRRYVIRYASTAWELEQKYESRDATDGDHRLPFSIEDDLVSFESKNGFGCAQLSKKSGEHVLAYFGASFLADPDKSGHITSDVKPIPSRTGFSGWVLGLGPVRVGTAFLVLALTLALIAQNRSGSEEQLVIMQVYTPAGNLTTDQPRKLPGAQRGSTTAQATLAIEVAARDPEKIALRLRTAIEASGGTAILSPGTKSDFKLVASGRIKRTRELVQLFGPVTSELETSELVEIHIRPL